MELIACILKTNKQQWCSNSKCNNRWWCNKWWWWINSNNTKQVWIHKWLVCSSSHTEEWWLLLNNSSLTNIWLECKEVNTTNSQGLNSSNNHTSSNSSLSRTISIRQKLRDRVTWIQGTVVVMAHHLICLVECNITTLIS